MSKKIEKINIMTITGRELREKLSKLPVIEGRIAPKRHQMIEGEVIAAHFQATKEKSPKHDTCILYLIRIYGPSRDNRLTIASKFKELLDNPSVEFPAKGLSDADSFYWEVEKVNKEAVS